MSADSAFLLQFPIQDKRGEGNEGTEKNEHTPAEGELFSDQGEKQEPTKCEKQKTMQRTDNAHGQGHVSQVFQRHRNAQEDQVGYAVEQRRKAELVDEGRTKLKGHKAGDYYAIFRLQETTGCSCRAVFSFPAGALPKSARLPSPAGFVFYPFPTGSP